MWGPAAEGSTYYDHYVPSPGPYNRAFRDAHEYAAAFLAEHAHRRGDLRPGRAEDMPRVTKPVEAEAVCYARRMFREVRWYQRFTLAPGGAGGHER